VFNTIARIEGSEKPNEYVMLSAHLDSWDTGSGATDNGTGTITMLEAMRILKTAYPHPKRTILVGHWSGEEVGEIGSGAFTAITPRC
jgi:Zn-dependent M28 family amino/carboxypeptidase